MSSQTPAPPPNPNIPGSTVLNGRYRLLAIVASGGMATVYKAQDTQLNRMVAVKMLRDRYARDPNFVQRFNEEAQAAANLNHPNIVTIFDVGQDHANGADRHYIVMEFLEGHDLKQTLRERQINGQRFEVEDAVHIIRQICEGVGYAHKRGLVHCDMKPQNVIISPDGHAEVADFGIARAYTASLNQRDEVVWGTPQYFSPEQATGTVPTPASDVYSIGVMLYELLAGKLPFDAKDAHELAKLHMTAEPRPLHQINPNVTLQLESIVRRAMSKQSQQRFVDADQFARTLAAYQLQGEEQTLGQAPIRPAAQSNTPTQRTAPTIPNTQPARPLSQGNTRQTGVASPTDPTVRSERMPTHAMGTSYPTDSTNAASPNTVNTPTQTVEIPEGPSIAVLLLGALALLCLLGLVPLYLRVYNVYLGPDSQIAAFPPTPTSQNAAGNDPAGATDTPVKVDPAGQTKVSVPPLVGTSVVQAQLRLQSIGLVLSVTQQITDTAVTEATITRQLTAPDIKLDPGSVVEVEAKVPPASEPVPNDLVGKTVDLVTSTLQSKGWTIFVSPTLSFQPENLILGTDPPAGYPLSVSGTLTLTVSSGGRVNLNTVLQNVVLESAKFADEFYVPGQTIQFEVIWRVTKRFNRDYSVGWYLLNGNSVVGQGEDRAPKDRGVPFPTRDWRAGTIVNDSYDLRIPADLPRGRYTVVILLYAGNDRLPVLNPGNAVVGNDSIVLRQIEVK